MRVVNFIKNLKFMRSWRKEKGVTLEFPFFSLTPTDSAECIDAYRNAMDFAFTRNDIKNIAVTGTYGSGKSSFLKTYFKGKKNVLWISLASFLGGVENASNSPSASKENNECSANERRLELSILQQIFYRVNANAVPYSRLCKTVSVPHGWYLKRVLWLLLVVLFIFGVWQPDYFIPFVDQTIRAWIASWDKVIFWLSGISLLYLLCLLVREMLHLIKTKNIRSVDVSGLGIKMAENTERSILNRNIDEIIYHFEAAKYQTVIFEDIDRFDDVDIFIKLREVNLLLNNADQIQKNHKPIRFVYALKEELFKDRTEKVKFFDFLIPIVPIINASNSKALVYKFLTEKCGIDEFCAPGLKKFIKDIAPYISDMRLIKNICNEFYSYKTQIPDCAIPVELLGMIVFKNFFPHEFALMHQGDGIIKDLLEVKSNAVQSELKRIDLHIQECRAEIEKIANEKITDIESLKRLYFYELMKLLQSEDHVWFKGNVISVGGIIKNADWFDALRAGELRPYYGRSKMSWDLVEKNYDAICSYEDHVSQIEGKINGRIELLKNRIAELQNAKMKTRRKSIVEMIESGAIIESMLLDKVVAECKNWQDKELFVLLVKNGYLNERYHYYISMFYEVKGASSRKDYYYEVEVSKGVESDWNKDIDQVKEVVENIELYYFSTPAILNYSICQELLKNRLTEKAQAFWGLISNKEKRSYEFVNGYINEEKFSDDADKLFDCIMIANPKYIDGLVELAYSEKVWPRNFVEKQLGLYISWVLRQGSVIKIAPMVKEYLDETSSFPSILKENEIDDEGQMDTIVKMFGLKFKTLDFKSAKETGFLDIVICNNAYEINETMILGLLESQDLEVGDFKNKNYSLIRECGVNAIVNYVDSEFQQYLGRVYARLDSMQEDDDATILHVLNREDLSDDDKGRFINKQTENGRIRNAKALNTEKALSLAVKLNWVVPSWNNAAEIWNRDKDDKSLFWEYVGREECYSCLATKNSREISWDKDQNWAKRFVEEKNLSDEAMSCLLLGMAKGIIPDYTGINATPKRIEYLVKGHRIGYSGSLYENLKGLNNDSHIVLAALCINEFCNTYTDGDITVSDMIKLLASVYLDSRCYVLVINTLKEIIIENEENEELRRVVAPEVNVSNFNKIDEQVLGAIFDYVKLESLQCKIIQHIGGTAIEIRERLKMMPEPYSKLGDKGCRPLIPRWNGLEEFLEFLKNKGVVSSFVLADDGKMQVNTTRS